MISAPFYPGADSSKGALHGIAPLMLGQDPSDIEGVWHLAFDNIMYHGYGGAELRALSAVEIALWDILGKNYQAPLVDLLGGKCRTCIPTYNTCLSFGPIADYESWHHDAGELARSLLDEGVGETRKIAAMAEAFGIPTVLHNVAGPVCHAACMHLGAHIPNLFFVESARALYKTYFGELSNYVPRISCGGFAVPEGPGLGIKRRSEALARPDLIRQISEGTGIAPGRRAMGDCWAQ
ncbi:MAG TPA: enolase C-terminal domain-like protein [Terriglobia bacterium]|nr:enolase C-terminal domain-like protein [Terriglobia bacterium]